LRFNLVQYALYRPKSHFLVLRLDDDRDLYQFRVWRQEGPGESKPASGDLPGSSSRSVAGSLAEGETESQPAGDS
jgi:hypothetical protein